MSAASDGNTGRTLEPVGITAGSIGLAALTAGLIWHFVEHPSKSETGKSEKGPAATGLRISPILAPRAAGISVEGSLQ